MYKCLALRIWLEVSFGLENKKKIFDVFFVLGKGRMTLCKFIFLKKIRTFGIEGLFEVIEVGSYFGCRVCVFLENFNDILLVFRVLIMISIYLNFFEFGKG